MEVALQPRQTFRVSVLFCPCKSQVHDKTLWQVSEGFGEIFGVGNEPEGYGDSGDEGRGWGVVAWNGGDVWVGGGCVQTCAEVGQLVLGKRWVIQSEKNTES